MDRVGNAPVEGFRNPSPLSSGRQLALDPVPTALPHTPQPCPAGPGTHHGVVVAVGVGVGVLLVPLVVLLLLQGRGFRLRCVLWRGAHAPSALAARAHRPLVPQKVLHQWW